MWSSVAASPGAATPPSRAKHSATLAGGHVYLLGGRNGNLPLKDLWRYSLEDGRWEVLRPSGDSPPCLQEHSAVTHRDSIYVFGGELGFSAGNETPLWIYNIKSNSWRKIRGGKGVTSPRGRRGHSALVHRGSMLIYGGYRDLRGSSDELWAFHFDTESWHLVSSGGHCCPPARHKHSAVIHDDSMWVYGGMTDLNERSDLWRFDTVSSSWSMVKTRASPGPLHSHAVCRLPSSMLVFGGERSGQPLNELWRFHFGTECWERLQTEGIKPQPRSESVALTVSDLLLGEVPPRGSPPVTRRHRGGGSVDRNNRVSPAERKYHRWSGSSYEGCTPCRKQPTTPTTNLSILKEITKLSQMNLSRLGPSKCSYSVLSSTESIGSDSSTGEMVKSQSANLIARSLASPCVPTPRLTTVLPRDPVSVPNFTSIGPCTLTPVEVTKLVYLDDEEAPIPGPRAQDFSAIHQQFRPRNNKGFPKSASVRFGNPHITPEEPSGETSDYASIETVNRVTYSKEGPYSFSNPNYMGPDIKDILKREDYVKVLNSPPDSVLEDAFGRSNSRQDMVEMKPVPPKSLSIVPNQYTQQLMAEKRKKNYRASSASRAERDPVTTFCIFLLGGKEHGQVTVFKRPLSVWKLVLTSEIY